MTLSELLATIRHRVRAGFSKAPLAESTRCEVYVWCRGCRALARAVGVDDDACGFCGREIDESGAAGYDEES